MAILKVRPSIDGYIKYFLTDFRIDILFPEVVIFNNFEKQNKLRP